jgi:hypothetical protein
MSELMPSFEQLKEFIMKNPGCTIRELCNHFKQSGDDNIISSDGKHVFACGIKVEFWQHLQNFMRQKYVSVEQDQMACLISDDILYRGRKKFLPIVLSIIE